jgi:hypothetical protein
VDITLTMVLEALSGQRPGIRARHMSWEYKTIAGQPHRKKGKKVQANWLGVWCDIPPEMWDWEMRK